MATTLEDLVSDRRRGAAAIAVDAAALLAGLGVEERERAAAALVQAHPAMAPLRLLARTEDPAAFGASLRRHLEDAAAAAAGLVRGLSVLTISASSLVEDALRRGRPSQIHCLRSDPGGEGSVMAERLGGRLWDDASLEEAVRHADVGLTGADAVGPDAFVNKVGTAALCRALPTVLVDVPEKHLGDDDFAACVAAGGDHFEVVPLSLVRRVP